MLIRFFNYRFLPKNEEKTKLLNLKSIFLQIKDPAHHCIPMLTSTVTFAVRQTERKSTHPRVHNAMAVSYNLTVCVVRILQCDAQMKSVKIFIVSTSKSLPSLKSIFNFFNFYFN